MGTSRGIGWIYIILSQEPHCPYSRVITTFRRMFQLYQPWELPRSSASVPLATTDGLRKKPWLHLGQSGEAHHPGPRGWPRAGLLTYPGLIRAIPWDIGAEKMNLSPSLVANVSHVRRGVSAHFPIWGQSQPERKPHSNKAKVGWGESLGNIQDPIPIVPESQLCLSSCSFEPKHPLFA